MPSMDDYKRKFAPTTVTAVPAVPASGSPHRTFSNLVAGVGAPVDTRLSFWNRWRLNGERQSAQKQVEVKKLEVSKQLALDWINREAELMRADFQRSFAERYTAIAESAMAAEFNAIRRLESLTAAARRMVMVDVKTECDQLQAMLVAGVISEENFIEDGALIVDRYEGVKREFSALCDQYTKRVREPFGT